MFPGLEYRWVQSMEEVHEDDSFKLIVANEFFDALPTLLFSRTTPCAPWREILIDGIDTGHDAEFRFIRAPSVTANSEFFKVNSISVDDGVSTYLEICPEAQRVSCLIAELISRHGGLFCTVDYGSTTCLRTSPSLRV